MNTPYNSTRPPHTIAVLVATSTLLLLSIATLAQAHGVILWCYVENKRVHVEAFFNGGRKVRNGAITVVNKAGEKVLDGSTDDQGLFNFEPPFQDDMTIFLRIDEAHGAEFELSKQDFLDGDQEAGQVE